MPESAWQQFAKAYRGDQVEVSELLSGAVIDAVARCLDAGLLVSFGMSRDGGALGVTLLSDGEPVRKWFHADPDALSDFLAAAADSLARR